VSASRESATAAESPASATDPIPAEGTGLAGRRPSLLKVLSLPWLGEVCLGVLLLIVLFCFLGPVFYHTNTFAANILAENQPPTAQHLLGMSPEGRDEIGQLMAGGQSTLEVGLGAGIVATLFGLIYGAVAGYVGGFVDALLMRTVDALSAIPVLFFAVLLGSMVRPTLWLIILIIAAVSWLSTARVVRGEVLRLRTLEYVQASRVFGGRGGYVIRRHLIPNVLGVVVVNGTLKVADSILLFASISFLGLGVPPPATDWGSMLTAGVNNLFDGYWWQLWPVAILIVVTVLAVVTIGDELESRYLAGSQRG
jgi:ABC-type dipeptide/oligopeptide/nickel transport system permease subunit